MYKPNLLFAIDVSGIPFGNTIISCVCFNVKHSPRIIYDFKKNFKRYKNKKGRQLNHTILSDIIQFLDDNKVRLNCMRITANDWRYALSVVPQNKAYKKEKLCGIFYYMLLESNSKYKCSYSVNMCKENFMDIDIVRKTCRTIAKMRGMEYEFSIGHDKSNAYIKIADYVASATRNMKPKELNSYRYYKCYKLRLPKEYVKKAFD